MATIKIYPPKQLPAEGVTESAFCIWKEELEVYLDVDDRFQKFLPGGDYSQWEAEESFPGRIKALKPHDAAADLSKFKRELRQFLTIIAKLINPDYYNPIIRHSTSLNWIYTRIRQDHNLELQGIFFLNILDVTWDPTGQTTPIGLYNNYRSLIMSNMGKTGDTIAWQNKTLTEDEKLTPSHEDLIFLNVLHILHPKLPAYIKDQYAHKIGQSKRIMDFKTEILNKAKQFIEEIEDTNIQASNIIVDETEYDATDPACNYVNFRQQSRPRFQRGSGRPSYRPRFQPSPAQPQPQRQQNQHSLSPFCRLCQLSNQPRNIYTSHYIGENTCPSMSQKDKSYLLDRATSQINHLHLEEPDLASEYGYDTINTPSDNQVHNNIPLINNIPSDQKITTNSTVFSDQPAVNFIKPVPTQTFTAEDKMGKNIHMDLDTGATVSYAKLSAVKYHNFTIKHNSQLSNLADGKTKMPSVGEIDETLNRNNFKVRYNAIVVKDLHCDFVGGNNFIKDNGVIQDLANKTITLHKKFVVPETNKMLILPTASNMILKNNHVNVVLPGQTVKYSVPHSDQQHLAVEPCFQNKSTKWPTPQLCQVSQGLISVLNDTNEIISLKNGSNKIQVRTLNEPIPQEAKCFATYLPTAENNKYLNVQINNDGIDKNVTQLIKDVNEKYSVVFNEDLSQGYNMHFGHHVCNLNWANDSRPPANKVHNINYDHDTRVLLQQVCDEFTQSGVLGIPSEHNIKIQHVSPAFLVRKQRAKHKPKQELTPKDVRLVINFGNLNEHLKNIPTPVTKPRDIFIHLGRWKYIIVMDLFQGFFQNHMAEEDGQWLGISTPFGGLRYVRRSGQGLLGQSEELDEMLSKVLSLEMQEGIVARIADDLYVGGSSPLETAKNYEKVIAKLHNANLKVSSEKTKVFLDSVDILGWLWKKGGYLSPSPHRINALKNTTHENIKCVKDLRSWLGLFKTMMTATPNLTLVLDPFDKLVADKASKDAIEWDESLKISFNKAKESIDAMQTLYLPDPNDQLLIVVDGAKVPPGIGHVLYAVKNNQKLPVSYHSNKLNETHSKWHSCEIEALAFATAITSEYNILKESKKPIIIAPDSKAVADAVNLIKCGNHSSNPRIQALITNVNRIPLIVQLANGKNKLNACADHQSRFPSQCQADYCTVCNFVNDSTDNTLNPYAINAAKADESPILLDNKAAWKQVQDNSKSCQQAKYYITSGKTPSKQSGKLLSEIRRLATTATINANDLLIVKPKPNSFSSLTNEQTVIPSSHLPAVLWQLHSTMNHPTKSQLKSQFDRSFYSVGLHPELDKLYENCHFCVSQIKIPSVVPHHSRTDTKIPGSNFHADVVKRKSQCILTVRDNFSTFTVAKIIKSENHRDLKDGIIDLLTPIKLAGEISVKVDNAPGFKPLLDNKDPDLTKLGIQLFNTDVFNKNENAVVDKACYELEQELVRIEPDGRPVSNTTIQYVVQLLNRKMRRNGSITAYDIYFNRDINTGENLNLDYDSLKTQQKQNREMHNKRHNDSLKVVNQIDPQPGDIVITNTSKPDKHKAKDIFLVTASQNDKVKIQKLIHSNADNPTLRSKSYVTDKSRLHVTRPHYIRPKKSVQHTSVTPWNPIQDPHDISSEEEYYVVPPIRVTATSSAVTSPSPSVAAVSISPPTATNSSEMPLQQITSPTSLYSSLQNTPNSTQRPEVYQQLDQWLQDQRQHAADQLSASITEINADDLSSDNEPNDLDNTYVAPTDKRDIIKARAKSKIAACYGKPLPQLDGAGTDSSAPTTSDPSPETSPEQIRPISNSGQSLYEKYKVNTDPFDWEWDFSDLDDLHHVSTDPDDIFDVPFCDVSFLVRSGSSHL